MCSAPVPSVRPLRPCPLGPRPLGPRPLRPCPLSPAPSSPGPLSTCSSSSGHTAGSTFFSHLCRVSAAAASGRLCVSRSFSVSFLASSYQPHPDRMKEFISSEQATHRPRARRGREAGRGPPRQPWPRSHGQAAPPCLERVPSTWPWGFPSDTCRGTKQGSKTRRHAGHSPGANRLPAPRLWELENTKNEGA